MQFIYSQFPIDDTFSWQITTSMLPRKYSHGAFYMETETNCYQENTNSFRAKPLLKKVI